VKKIRVFTPFLLFALLMSAPTIAHADTNSARLAGQQNSKQSMKAYHKHLKKEQKKARRAQKKALKDSKKRHPSNHS
jgi:hypothetical protein